MHLHELCDGHSPLARKITVLPTHGVTDDPQLLAPQAPARQRVFIQPCLDHLVPATGVQEGEREEILARSFSFLKPMRCLADLFSHPSSLSTVPLPATTSVLPPEKARSAAGRKLGVFWICRLR